MWHTEGFALCTWLYELCITDLYVEYYTVDVKLLWLSRNCFFFDLQYLR